MTLPAPPLRHSNTVRTDSQVVRIGVAKVDELILDRLRDLRPLHDAIHRVLGREHVVDVGAVHCALDVGLERWLDLFREEFLPVDCAMRQPAELGGNGEGREGKGKGRRDVLLLKNGCFLISSAPLDPNRLSGSRLNSRVMRFRASFPISSGNLSGSFKIFLYISDVFSTTPLSMAYPRVPPERGNRVTDHHKTAAGPRASRTTAHRTSTSRRACRTRHA